MIKLAEAERGAVTVSSWTVASNGAGTELQIAFKDISGLENFKNLENLNLNFHAIEDISPLSGLTKLRSLSLGGNPVADIAPLSNLTGLGSLTLFNCQAKDYTPLSKLSGLGMLLLEYSTISDVSMPPAYGALVA